MALVNLNNVTLDYPLYGMGPQLLSRKIASLATAGKISSGNKHHYVRSLDGIDLELKAGDSVGLIGGNGAGKTSLLKVISGIYRPSHGKLTIEGNVTPMLGHGFGLDLEATGYENIVISGLNLGLDKSFIDENINSIAEFTKLGEFLNMPLKSYSAGMRARLSFAVSTCFQPEILAIDEGFGVGDKSFFKSAQDRLHHIMGSASILILASHSDALLRQFCNKGLVLNSGKISFQGPIDDALKFYNDSE